MTPKRGQRLFQKDWTTSPYGKIGQFELATPLCTVEQGQVPATLRPTQETRVRAPGAGAPEPQSIVVQKEARRARSLLARGLHQPFPFLQCSSPRSRPVYSASPEPDFSKTTGSFLESKHGTQRGRLTAGPSRTWSPSPGHSLGLTREPHFRASCHCPHPSEGEAVSIVLLPPPMDQALC